MPAVPGAREGVVMGPSSMIRSTGPGPGRFSNSVPYRGWGTEAAGGTHPLTPIGLSLSSYIPWTHGPDQEDIGFDLCGYPNLMILPGWPWFGPDPDLPPDRRRIRRHPSSVPPRHRQHDDLCGRDRGARLSVNSSTLRAVRAAGGLSPRVRTRVSPGSKIIPGSTPRSSPGPSPRSSARRRTDPPPVTHRDQTRCPTT